MGNTIVLRPLEKLLAQIRSMAATIFKSIKDMASAEEEEEDDDEKAEEEGTGDLSNAFGNETSLLDKVVAKLALLESNKKSGNEDLNLSPFDEAMLAGFQEFPVFLQ